MPEYLNNKLNDLVNILQNCENGVGLSIIEINSLIRANNMWGQVPRYSVEELSIIFEYYQQFMIAINKYTKFIPTKRNFCAFCGISTAVYNNWLKKHR